MLTFLGIQHFDICTILVFDLVTFRHYYVSTFFHSTKGGRIIENCVKPVVKEIWKQRRSNGTKGIKLLDDNAGAHRHSDVLNYLTEQGINIMPHPLYSPDLAPCDYWLNDYIKNRLTDQPDEKSLARAVSKIVKNISEEEFKKAFDKLLERMELCINNHGNYFEHLMK